MLNKNAAITRCYYEESKAYREKVRDPIWKQVSEYLWSDQNIRRTTQGDQNDFVINLIWKDYQTVMSMLSRGVPSVELVPLTQGEEMLDIRDALKKALNHVLISNDIIVRQEEMLSCGIPFGRGYFKTTWDRSMRLGLGDIRIESPDTRNIFLPPGCSRLRNALIMFERMLFDKLSFLHTYPDEKKNADDLFKISLDPALGADTAPSGSEKGYGEEGGNTHSFFLGSGIKGKDEKREIEVVQAWFQDPTVLKMMPELYDKIKTTSQYKNLSMDKQYEAGEMRIFPRGRMQVFSGDHLISDSPNPFPSFPYTEYVNALVPHVKPGDELGMGEFDPLLEIQDMLNQRINQIADGMDSAPFGGWGIIGRGVGLDIDEMESRPRGLYQAKGDPRASVWFNTSAVPPEAFKSVADIIEMYHFISNRQNILQGDLPGDIRSGSGVRELADLANSVMIPRTHALEASYRSLVRYCIHMIGMYYDKGEHYTDNVELGGVNPDAFEIFITAGMNLPSTQAARDSLRMALYDRGLLNKRLLANMQDDAVLPNKEAVLQEMEPTWSAEEQALQGAMRSPSGQVVAMPNQGQVA